MQKLYDYIVSRGTIIPITDYNKDMLSRGDVSKRVQVRCVTVVSSAAYESPALNWESSFQGSTELDFQPKPQHPGVPGQQQISA